MQETHGNVIDQLMLRKFVFKIVSYRNSKMSKMTSTELNKIKL